MLYIHHINIYIIFNYNGRLNKNHKKFIIFILLYNLNLKHYHFRLILLPCLSKEPSERIGIDNILFT